MKKKPKSIRLGGIALKCDQDERGEIAHMTVSDIDTIHIQLHSVPGIRKLAGWLNAYCDWREGKEK